MTKYFDPSDNRSMTCQLIMNYMSVCKRRFSRITFQDSLLKHVSGRINALPSPPLKESKETPHMWEMLTNYIN